MLTQTYRYACLVALVLTSAACRTTAPTASTALLARTNDPIELQFDSPAPVTVEFQGPDGTVIHSQSFPSDREQHVRFTATQIGTWQYVARAGERTVQEGSITVAPGKGHGFIRAHGHSLSYADGTPFVALGENRINIYDPEWNWHELSIEDYVKHMAQHGQSVLRVFIVSDVENEESGGSNLGVLEPALGQFDETVAAQFDTIMRAAFDNNIQVVLVAFALGFSEDDAWKSWQDNPYSTERGGPAESRFDFFESEAPRVRAAARIRYLAARYAAFPNLLAIDLLNEPEWDGSIPEVSWGPWAQTMTQVWDAADPYDHLVTVGSVGLHWNIEGDERAWWSSDACDIVQWHLYGKETYEVHALAAEMTRKVKETWMYDKPVLVGEFAYGGEAKPDYDHTHVGLWSAAFSGAGVLAHSAPPFNEDSDELMTPERAAHYRVLRETLTELGIHSPIAASASGQTSAWALKGDKTAAVWLLAPKPSYGQPVSDVRVTLAGLSSGRWRVEWSNDVSGELLTSSDVSTVDGTLELIVPTFSRHVVGRLSPER